MSSLLILILNHIKLPLIFVSMMHSDGQIEHVTESATDQDLSLALRFRVAYYHSGLTPSDNHLIQDCSSRDHIQVLILSYESLCNHCPQSHSSIIMSTHFYHGHYHPFVHHPLADILHILHSPPQCHLFCPPPMQSFYTHVLLQPLPLESQLDQCIHDLLNS